ncbi:MAG TPA: rod shape-determining protein MreD [Terriglobales bacterium]|nr:rod shape-determining protein MreD [Terriglobales bacterium]
MNLSLSKTAGMILLILIVVIYQSLFAGLVTIHQIRLDLPMLILVYIGLSRGPASGAIFGFLVGFLLDLASPSSLGLGAFIKTCLGYLVGSFKDNLYLENNLSKGAVIFFSLILNDLLYYFFSNGIKNLSYSVSVFLNYSLLSGLYTALVGLLILWLAQMRKAKEITI